MLAALLGARGVAAQGPPSRFFGTVTVDGATPALGTKVEALVQGNVCGEGVVRELGAEIGIGYVVDVKSDAQQSGCGNDGSTVKIRVGGREAPQSETYVTGGFVRLDLSVSGAVQTPPPGPTPPPFVQAATPAPSASSPPAPSGSPAGSAPSSPAPSASPSAGVSPSASGSPSGSPSASPSASASPSPSGGVSPSPSASTAGSGAPSPSGLSVTIASPEPASSSSNRTAIWLGVAVALIAGAALAALAYMSRRNRDDGGGAGDGGTV